MDDIDPRTLGRESYTMTCACGAVFEVAVSRLAVAGRRVPGCRLLRLLPRLAAWLGPERGIGHVWSLPVNCACSPS